MMELSESFFLGAGGMSLTFLIAVLWYARSILLTSRCSECSLCGLIKVTNQPLTETTLTDIVTHETPPTLHIPQQSSNGRHLQL